MVITKIVSNLRVRNVKVILGTGNVFFIIKFSISLENSLYFYLNSSNLEVAPTPTSASTSTDTEGKINKFIIHFDYVILFLDFEILDRVIISLTFYFLIMQL